MALEFSVCQRKFKSDMYYRCRIYSHFQCSILLFLHRLYLFDGISHLFIHITVLSTLSFNILITDIFKSLSESSNIWSSLGLVL